MKQYNTKRTVLALCKVLHWTALAAVLLIGVLGVSYELLDYPVWEELVGKIGITDGIGFGWIVGTCGIVVFLLTDWLEGRLSTDRLYYEKTLQGGNTDESSIS